MYHRVAMQNISNHLHIHVAFQVILDNVLIHFSTIGMCLQVLLKHASCLKIDYLTVETLLSLTRAEAAIFSSFKLYSSAETQQAVCLSPKHQISINFVLLECERKGDTMKSLVITNC